ncbi:MAG: bifunctional aspartate kinase/homoserine dehydrogenase I [Melioribacteraceae bacterium]|nr:bifunctional aspartate kinase/homoserine dehydrogenase I [Melioribacteraceae bacterium]
MKVLKYGGSSVGNAERISNVINILDKYYLSKNEKIAVVFSAFQGVTDKLIEIGKLSLRRDENYKRKLNELIELHTDIIDKLNTTSAATTIKNKAVPFFNSMAEISDGIFLVRELSLRTLDYLMSFGERLSCLIIAETMRMKKYPTEYLDSSRLIKTDDGFGNAKVNFDETYKNIKQYFKKSTKTQIITGFIASSADNEITTLGRGGSDYTASIFGAALNVSEIQIWTDVDGILTADPRKVKDSFSLKAVTYEEAMELSHFGAKVIHPPTMHPALKSKIKIRIKNTFKPEFPGTVILERESSVKFNMKGISSIDDISLVRLQGSGMVGVTGIASRLFGALARNNINIILITQGSSEHSICFAVTPDNGGKAQKAIYDEFKYEIIEGKIAEAIVENGLSIIAVVGEDMKQTPGVSGRVFQALGRNGINIHAIAQGSSELNISLVISKLYLHKALNILHDDLFIATRQTLNIFMTGPGLVGSELLTLINKKLESIKSRLNTNIRVVGLANSRKMTFNEEGINISEWQKILHESPEKSDPKKFIDKMKEMNLGNSIFVDCTAKNIYVPCYKSILSTPISIVTPNKIANSGSQEEFNLLRETAIKNNIQFRYGTNVGAALPIINTLRDLVNNGDEIVKIEGVLSGTLSYIFNSLNTGTKFSDVVLDARKKGYTEPDPRDDLSGLDVARKLIILIRESRIKYEMKNIKVENLVPVKARKVKSVDEFMRILKQKDPKFAERLNSADKKNKKLCYIARYENGIAKVGIEEIDNNHPFYNLSGTDNIVSFTTKNYNDKPLVIKGPGAGASFTAFGVLVDIMRTSNYLG